MILHPKILPQNPPQVEVEGGRKPPPPERKMASFLGPKSNVFYYYFVILVPLSESKSNVFYHYFVILTSSLGSKSNVFYHYFVILPPFSGSKSNVFYHYFGIKPAPDPSPRRSKGEEGRGRRGGGEGIWVSDRAQIRQVVASEGSDCFDNIGGLASGTAQAS